MIEAQLEVVRKYPENSPRRAVIEPELIKDLEYVVGNMTINPKVLNRRENMRTMHNDFFALLKWQREKMLRVPFDEPHKLTGDIEALQAELKAKAGETVEEAVAGKLVPDDVSHDDAAKTTAALNEMTIQERAAAGGCPVAHKIPAGATMDQCPVAHKATDDAQANGTPTGDFSIHRLY